MRDLVIIGSGPAGLSAAIYAKRAMMDVVVMEKAAFSGGQIVNTEKVDNYLGMPGISGFDMAMKFREHADLFEIEFDDREVMSLEDHGDHKTISLEDGTDLDTRAVLVTTGARHRNLGVPGEEEFAGAGVSYCATCDGAFFRKRTVAVVGGGDVAVEDAIFLAGLCSKVYLIHRRDSLRAADSLQKKLMSMENVEILWNCEVKEIQGEDMVEKILVYHNQDDSQSEIEVNGVFIAVGIHPNTELYQGLVEMDEQGYVLADESCKTTVDGIYAAGDIRKKALRQIITAVADGANAVTSAQNYLNKV